MKDSKEKLVNKVSETQQLKIDFESQYDSITSPASRVAAEHLFTVAADVMREKRHFLFSHKASKPK